MKIIVHAAALAAAAACAIMAFAAGPDTLIRGVGGLCCGICCAELMAEAILAFQRQG